MTLCAAHHTHAGLGQPDCLAHMGPVSGIEPTADGRFVLSNGVDGACAEVPNAPHTMAVFRQKVFATFLIAAW